MRVAKDKASRSPTAEQVLEQADALYHFARHVTRKATLAESLTRETLQSALGSLESVGKASSVKVGLFRALRDRQLEAARRDGLPPKDDALDPRAGAEFPRTDAELERLRSAAPEAIDAAVSHLSADARALVFLDLEGFSEDEMAEVLGTPAPGVRERLARARGALRSQLAESLR
jgi:RNA polymerase sigma-70 factor (ECF subfamily)